jgi:hypothetical protein
VEEKCAAKAAATIHGIARCQQTVFYQKEVTRWYAWTGNVRVSKVDISLLVVKSFAIKILCGGQVPKKLKILFFDTADSKT